MGITGTMVGIVARVPWWVCTLVYMPGYTSLGTCPDPRWCAALLLPDTPRRAYRAKARCYRSGTLVTRELPSRVTTFPFHCWSMLRSCGEEASLLLLDVGNEAKSVLPSCIRSLMNVERIRTTLRRQCLSLGLYPMVLELPASVPFLTFRPFLDFLTETVPLAGHLSDRFRPETRGNRVYS